MERSAEESGAEDESTAESSDDDDHVSVYSEREGGGERGERERQNRCRDVTVFLIVKLVC